MRFIHRVTRAVIDSPTLISGGDWVPLEEEKAEAAAPAPAEDAPAAEPRRVKKDMTKAEIMEALDAEGIRYNPTKTKAQLAALLLKGSR